MGDRVSLAGFKFCCSDIEYSDIEDDGEKLEKLEKVENQYAQQVANLKSQHPGVRFFHVTTPVEGNDDWVLNMNVMRMEFADWLRQTYGTTEIVFDLQDIESRRADGSVCQSGDTRYLCEENDWSNDSGHPNPETQVRLAKAFLYMLHTAAQ